jgi:SAM-dependent methyltransferase
MHNEDAGSIEIDPHDHFPPGFFSRSDETPDHHFYSFDRLVTHIDDGAIAAVSRLYSELGLSGSVLDIMSSWISHFATPPAELVVLGMNERELRANEMATDVVVHDLNIDPRLPFVNDRFDAVTCCVSIDYLTRPVDVLKDAGRVTKPGGFVVCTFSNRCFPTKAIRGWLMVSERERLEIVKAFFDLTHSYVHVEVRQSPGTTGDPLYAVWGTVR